MLIDTFFLCFLLISMTGGESQPGRNHLQTKYHKLEASQPEHPQSSDHSTMKEKIVATPDEKQMPLRHDHSGTSIHPKAAVRGWKKVISQQKRPKSSAHLIGKVTTYTNMNFKATNDPTFVPYPLKHIKDHPQSKATSSWKISNRTQAKAPNQFKQMPSTQEMKDKPTERNELDIPFQKQFMFVARSKLPDLIKQTDSNVPSSLNHYTAASNNVFGQNSCSNEQRRSVTFEQAKDSITHAWQQCDGNPHCQLMQILGGIDNTLELQDWLIEQISFLNKLFVIQRNLITDVYDVHFKILDEKHNLTSNSTVDAGNRMKSPENETKHKHDPEKSLLSKSDSQDEYNDFVKPHNGASNMAMKEYSGKQATSKKSSIFVKSPRAVDKYKLKLRASLNKLNKKDAHVKKVEHIEIINEKNKQTALSTDLENVGNKIENENGSLTRFQSRKLLGSQSAQTLKKMCNRFSKPAGGKKRRSAREVLVWKLTEVGMFCVLSGIYVCYYLFRQDRNLIYRACVAIAAVPVFIIYTIIAHNVKITSDGTLCADTNE